MSLWTRAIRRVGRTVSRVGDEMIARGGHNGTWIDVGAHYGESTLETAIQNPKLRIYALEPNLSAASRLIARAPNYFVVPFAVAERNGIADFHISSFDVASSLLPFNESTLSSWVGGEGMKVDSVVSVPTIRLDTFMELTGIQKVDFLKVDAQGADLAVIRSAGRRIDDIGRIMVEVDVSPVRLYEGSASRDEMVSYLQDHGFVLTEVQAQSHAQEQNLTFVRQPLAVVDR
jgi:FkbM family methyltransferase